MDTKGEFSKIKAPTSMEARTRDQEDVINSALWRAHYCVWNESGINELSRLL